ncbi:MFS transporter [Gordonia sp. NB41Y]|uniref:MFS transporter n=1 Tax=Gordonia sp. NB41Y TaxID=875808 RepID=UPI0006B1C9F3|nr:MFS transporter [Gordonia sp. NB41Y]EMP13917.2 hypothetical protein ISGA_215 [Gordonia sp. NB41Y]WLP88683.1 MFS transporter [Gordonia sp. NB41Y]
MVVSAAATGVTSRLRPWMAVWAGIFACTWGGNQFSPLLLMYEERVHYSSIVVNGLLGIYVLGLIPALLIAGAMSDRRGRKRLMLGGVLATITGSVLLALGPFGLGFLAAGRLFSGIGVGVAMAVGTSWMTELSMRPYDAGARPGTGARRSAVVFGTGSACGALVAGLLAQWGPLPETLPFLVHIALSVPALAAVLTAPETHRAPADTAESVSRRGFRAPGMTHKRFLLVVMIASPWLFGGAAIGYGYLPTRLEDATGAYGLVFATSASVIALATSSLVQPFARWIHSENSARGLIVAVLALTAGIALATVSIDLQSIILAVVSNVAIGAGIGIGQVSGLLEVQRIAGPSELAVLTGAFYSLAYVGFFLPLIIAGLAVHVGLFVVLWSVVALAALTVLGLAFSSTKHLPPVRGPVEVEVPDEEPAQR